MKKSAPGCQCGFSQGLFPREDFGRIPLTVSVPAVKNKCADKTQPLEDIERERERESNRDKVPSIYYLDIKLLELDILSIILYHLLSKPKTDQQ